MKSQKFPPQNDTVNPPEPVPFGHVVPPGSHPVPELVAALDLEGVSVSSGSACSAGTSEPSPVVTAMVGAERARSAVRISLGEETTASDVEQVLAAFERVLGRTRA